MWGDRKVAPFLFVCSYVIKLAYHYRPLIKTINKDLLKPRSNESPEHFFIVKKLEEFIKKYADKVEIYETREPDIVFEVKGKKVAIEVETGVKYKNDKKKLLRKIANLNRLYKDDWYFVVTDWSDKEKYQKLGKAHARREM